MKTLGLIGGTSWHATVEYYKLINQLVAEKIGAQSNPELIIHSINIEVMRKQDKNEINTKYLEVATKLQEAGAEAIVICANTPHMAYDYVQPKIHIPFLHIATATGDKAKKLGLNTLGLLGNRPTMTGHFIPEPLERDYHIKTIIPKDEFAIDRSHFFISKQLTQGQFTQEAKDFYLEQIALLKKRGAQGIILGCTELPLLLNESDVDLPMLPTTNLHAQMAADFILS